MRRLILNLIFLLAAISLKAQPLNGIRINGGETPILVYFGGNQMCMPTTTCFVTNLKRGYYTVEVFSTRYTRTGERVWKGRKLFHERIYFNGMEVKDIFVESDPNLYPDFPRQREEYDPSDCDMGYEPYYGRIMSPKLFDTFYNKVKSEPFDSDRMTMIETAITSSYFTSAQCLRLTKLYTFDDERMKIMKIMYPRIVDKEAFFTVISTLTFSSNKDEMNGFVRTYRENRR